MYYRKYSLILFVHLLTFIPNYGSSQLSEKSYSFLISKGATTSAGIFKTDGTLIRTLWSNKFYNPGKYEFKWDGTDDLGDLVENGNYVANVLSNNVNTEWEGVIGNTSTSKTGTEVHRGYAFISDMCISKGFIYYSNTYDEQHNTQHKASTSHPNTALTLAGGGEASTFLTCTDGINVYWGSSGPVNGNYNTFFVFATKVADDTRATFSSGTNVTLDYSHGTYNSFGYDTGLTFTKIATQRTGKYFFACETSGSNLYVYDKNTGAAIRIIGVNGIKTITIDSSDNIWIGTATTLRNYIVNSDGTITSGAVSITGFINIKTLGVSYDGAKILACDGSTSQQVKAFSILDGSYSWTLGTVGGYAEDPNVNDSKFYFDSLYNFISFQSDGSFWVGDGMNYRIQHYNSLMSYVDRIMYCPNAYSIAVDKNDSSRVFLRFLEFKVDYSKNLLTNNGSWKLVKNWATPRILLKHKNQFVYLSDVITFSNGKTFCLSANTDNSQFELMQLNDTTGLISTGQFYLYASELCKDGVYNMNPISSKIGDSVKWIKYPFMGFNNRTVPQFGDEVTFASAIKTANDPISNGDVNNLTFGEIQNGNVITFDGGVSTNPYESKGYHLGALKISTNKFIFKTAYNTHKDYAGDFPKDERYDIGNGTNYPGSKARVIGDFIVQGYHGEFWKQGQTNEYKLFYKNGLFLKSFGTNIKNVRGEYAPAEMAGNATAMCVTKNNDTLYLYHGDESYHSGLHRWKLTGLNTVQVQTIQLTASFERTNEQAVLPGVDLMEGLAFDSVLTGNSQGWSRYPMQEDYSSFDKYWSVKTNVKTYDKRKSPDVWIKYQHPNRPYTVNRDLGSNINLSSWALYGLVNYEDNSPNAAHGTSMFLQILDNQGRILVRFYTTIAYDINNTISIYANNTLIHSGSFNEIKAVTDTFQSINLSMIDGFIKVKYANYPSVNVTAFDTFGNINNPRTMQLYFNYDSLWNVYNKIIDLYEFRFAFTKNGSYFRSISSGKWNTPKVWQSSTDSIIWVNSLTVPDTSANATNIQKGHVIAITDSATIDQLVINNGGVLKVAPNASLIVNDGPGDDITIAPTGSLVIQSDSTGTGRIGNSSGTITGNVTVEHYINSYRNKGFRLLSPSVNTYNSVKPFIRDNWQEGQNNNSLTNNSNILAYYGTHITGSTNGDNGFDETRTGLPSLFTYDQTSSLPDWVAAANTDATDLEAKKGYLMYISGDRNIDLNSNDSSSNTTLRATGSIAVGTQTFPNQEGNGRISLVTNPYPCPVDWNLIYNNTSTFNARNFEKFYTLWDSHIGTSGGYVTVGSNGIQSAATNATTKIETGAAFFIRAKPGVISPEFIINESDKSSARVDTIRLGSGASFMTSLYYSNNDSTKTMADAVNNVFDKLYSSDVTGNDAEDMANPEEDIAILRSGKMLSIEARPLIKVRDTLPLFIQRLKIRNYEWQFNPLGLAKSNLQATLEDKFLNTSKPLSLTVPTIVPFSISNDTASSAHDRFRVLFNTIIPMTFVSIKAYQKNTGIQVEWKTANEKGVEKYKIEKSYDNKKFTVYYTIPSKGSGSANNYKWFDISTREGIRYYRIKAIDTSGIATYSKTVNVNTAKKELINIHKDTAEVTKEASLVIFPNPVETNTFGVRFNNIPKGIYSVKLINNIGQPIFTKTIDYIGGSAAQMITITHDFLPGVYNFQIKGNGLIFNNKILK